MKYSNGLTLSTDQTQLYVAENATHWIWVYQIKPDGTLTNKQRYGWLHVPDNADNAGADGMKTDQNNRVYAVTRLGIQVMDDIGRVISIIPVPIGNGPANMCFGGPDFDVLYITCKDKVYRRKVGVKGANSFAAPFKPVTAQLDR